MAEAAEGDGGDSGHVSQSPSSASGLGAQGGEDGGALEATLSAAAAAYAACVLPERAAYSAEMESFEENLEDLLTRVDEFVGMLDMIRSDSSQVVNESLPEIYTKATEMRHIYRKIDKLEAFVKMVGNCVAEMEERVTKAETELGAFPSTFKKILHTISLPAFLNESVFPHSMWCLKRGNIHLQAEGDHLEDLMHLSKIPIEKIQKSASSRQQQPLYEPPTIFRTEDYFPCVKEGPYS